jgi:hypothetical protein
LVPWKWSTVVKMLSTVPAAGLHRVFGHRMRWAAPAVEHCS